MHCVLNWRLAMEHCQGRCRHWPKCSPQRWMCPVADLDQYKFITVSGNWAPLVKKCSRPCADKARARARLIVSALFGHRVWARTCITRRMRRICCPDPPRSFASTVLRGTERVCTGCRLSTGSSSGDSTFAGQLGGRGSRLVIRAADQSLQWHDRADVLLRPVYCTVSCSACVAPKGIFWSCAVCVVEFWRAHP